MTMKVPAGYLNLREACDRLGVSRYYLTRLVVEQRIAYLRVTDGKRARLAFLEDDITAYLAVRRVEAAHREAHRAIAAVPIREVRPRPRKSIDLPEAKRYA